MIAAHDATLPIVAVRTLLASPPLPCAALHCITPRPAPSPWSSCAVWQEGAIRKIMDVNVVSAVLLAKAAVPRMTRGGAILFVSSYTAFNPSPPIAM